MPNAKTIATYRLQHNSKFRFVDTITLVEYFHDLGISHIYSSPILKAKSSSIHGYDITDPTQINPEIGSMPELEHLVENLQRKSMGLILDIIPNHMYIGNSENPWWNSVLEKGVNSPFADFFDVDWHPPRKIFDNKVYLPILNQLFGKVLENKLLQVVIQNGKFNLIYEDLILPTDPLSWKLILEPLYFAVKNQLQSSLEVLNELQNIISELNYPNIEKRIDDLLHRQPALSNTLETQLKIFNGIKNDPLSFNSLEEFLNLQHYRLCYWRVANEEINYRRFFDVYTYASLRIENEITFQAVHQLIFQLIQKGWVDGLRIDHIDGLWDPLKYLKDLSNNINPSQTLILAEKILMGNEKMREWPLDGGVGYDFLNQVNDLFVYQANKQQIFDIYRNFTGIQDTIGDQKYKCKKLILNSSLASELHLLTLRLNSIAERHRYYYDFSFESLKKALTEIIAYFPVYRSYVRGFTESIGEEDKRSISVSISRARRHNYLVDRSVYDFLEDTLFLRYPMGVSDAYKAACCDFIMHFQQVTGPVMAKGYEDTAFYRYYPLSSLNEVGGDPSLFGISKETFHKKNIERLVHWPLSMLATTTHDTKRSEDVRARINILSEIPEEWDKVSNYWRNLNESYKVKLGDEIIPDANEEYLLYQTLIGACPFSGIDENFVIRIQNYMEKAIKEAKINNNWMDPNEKYDQGIKLFIKNICNNPAFIDSFNNFFSRIASLGMLNSLSQLILKLTSPGLPDIYQGCEFWNFTLVDPDNRQLVDYTKNISLSKKAKTLAECIQTPEDGVIKYFVTKILLQLRKQNPQVFINGSYRILNVIGKNEENVIAFARELNQKVIIIISTRFYTSIKKNFHDNSENWLDTYVEIPKTYELLHFRNVFTANVLKDKNKIILDTVFSEFPFLVIESF